ncbi:hypothetical protein M9H77_02273 [Catharanthus roseus]|uniref:Uncharacterized protein n=1 Tax=Catharanthus roseus TaxID=4058 RepID=A0ACC0C7Z1_CATRO|nr:hypothetical protein M9H77_02273 [Catharanthus roseus]
MNIFIKLKEDVDLETFEEFIETEEARFDRQQYVTIGCERGGGKEKKVRLDDDDEDEKEVPVKRKGPYGTKKCNCPFQLKEEKLAIEDNWKLYVKDRRHNHKIGVYPHGHAQAARCQVAPRNIMVILLEKNLDCAVSKQIIYNTGAKMKKKRWRNVIRYNMPLLVAVRMTLMGKTFTVATAFMWNEKAETYE